MIYQKLLKRTIDVSMAVLGLIFLSPLFFIFAIAIKSETKGPVFFVQNRIGKNKKVFRIYKFRTMTIDAPKDFPTHLLTDSSTYVTKVGRILRKTSLDELPQLINILKGEMSIVGPRPALWNQYDLIEERDKYSANHLLPGLTGWAQINGRDKLSIEKKAKLDGEYSLNMGFLFDVRIFFLTIIRVIKNDGIFKESISSLKDKR